MTAGTLSNDHGFETHGKFALTVKVASRNLELLCVISLRDMNRFIVAAEPTCQSLLVKAYFPQAFLAGSPFCWLSAACPS